MRNLRNVLCLVLVLSCVLCFAACGGSSIAGKYDLVKMESNGMTLELEELREYMGDAEMYLELKSDGTGKMVMDTDVSEMKYADGKIWPVDDADDKASFTVKDGTLTIEEGDVVMVFKKQ